MANNDQNGNGRHAIPFSLQQQRRFVDFLNKRSDHECAMLLAMGYSTTYIASKTRLSPGQVSYRAWKSGISRAEYRNGSSPFAKAVLQVARGTVEVKLLSHLRREGLLYAHAA